MASGHLAGSRDFPSWLRTRRNKMHRAWLCLSCLAALAWLVQLRPVRPGPEQIAVPCWPRAQASVLVMADEGLRRIALGQTPGPFRLTAKDYPAELLVSRPGFQDAHLRAHAAGTLPTVRLKPKSALLALPALVETAALPFMALLSGLLAYRAWRREEKRVQAASQLLQQAQQRGPQVGDVIEGHRLERLIGQGGMGKVFLSQDGLAVKVLQAGSEDRFLQEARLYRDLSHPALVRLHAVGTWAGHPYLVTDFVAGTTLEGSSRDQPWQWAEQLLELIVYLASQGVVHRDLKPANLMVGPDHKIKVLDFGIAHQGAHTGSAVGTPGFAAPEQVRAQPVDWRADAYAWAGVFHYLLYGRPPFEESTPLQVIKRQLEGPWPELPGGLGRLFQPEPEKRGLQSAQKLLEEFRAIAADASSNRPPESPPTSAAPS